MLDWLLQVFQDHWPSVLLSLLGIFLGTWWGRRRAKRQWQRKEFLHRLNVSLNTIDGGTLKIRTVLEKDLLDVMLNRVAVDEVLRIAHTATAEDPILRLPEQDAWFLLNGVLNEISERFAVGLLRCDLGTAATRGDYLLCLTFEIAGAVRTHKVRAMLIRRDLLENLPAERPALESPHHATRWDTLHRMAALWQTEQHHFLQVEIAV